MSDIRSFFGGGGTASKKELTNPPPNFNRVDYKSLTRQKRKEYNREIINKIGLCESVKLSHPQLYEILTKDVIPCHPKYPEKCNGMVDLAIRNNEKHGNLEGWIKFADGREDNISLMKDCVTRVERVLEFISDYLSSFSRMQRRHCMISGSNNLRHSHKHESSYSAC